MNNKLNELIKKTEYEDKYEETIEYFENELKENNIQKNKLISIICKYYILKEPNIKKIIYYCNYLFKNNEEKLSYNNFEWYIKKNKTNIESLEQYDYPFIHKYLGEIQYEKNIKQAIEHFKKGAEQKSFFCASRMFEYYTTGTAYFEKTTKLLENIDFEKAIYYADLLTQNMNLRQLEKIYNKNTIHKLLFKPLDETKKISRKEKNKINNMIMNSGSLLFYKSLEYIDQDNPEMFLYYCELSATKGYYEANFLLAQKYIQKDFKKRNLKKALYYSKKAYEINENYISSNLYYEIIMTIINEKQVKLFDSISKKFINSHYLNIVGNMYLFGKGVKQDYKKALEYYKEAIKNGNLSKLNDVGYMHQIGKGVKQDYKKALEYYELAAKNGDIHALNNIGIMYQMGRGVKQDFEKAEKCYEETLKIDPKNKRAQKELLGIRYIRNEMSKNDYIELFEIEEYFFQQDEYIKKIKDKLKKGSKIIVEQSIKNLILGKLNEIPEDTIINLRNTVTTSHSYCKNFYTCKDMKKIIEICNEIINDIDINQNEEDKFMQIYIKLGIMLSYDHMARQGQESEQEKNSISRNAMALIYKKGVCAAYAASLKILLELIGIESEYILSNKHVYNQVKLNGIWYNCDITWDSHRIKQGGPLKYCLKSREYFQKNSSHQPIDEEKSTVHETTKDFKNITRLFYKNYLKLIKNKIKNKVEKQITTSPIKEEKQYIKI